MLCVLVCPLSLNSLYDKAWTKHFSLILGAYILSSIFFWAFYATGGPKHSVIKGLHLVWDNCEISLSILP